MISRAEGLLALAALFCVMPAFPARSDPTLANGGVKNVEEYRRFAFSQEGNSVRGAQLFGDNQRVACALCHSVDGKASKAGPDLSTIGDKYGRSDLIKAILAPSADIAVGYGATYVETRAGAQQLGVIKRATDAWVELMGADGKTVRIATSDIKERRENNISLMPEGLYATLSLQEFTDLIEYLVSLKEPVNALRHHRGFPATIPELKAPVTLEPFVREELRFPHSFVHQPGDERSGLVWFGQVPGLDSAFLVAHQTGKIWLLDKKDGNDATKTLFADFAGEVFCKRGPNGLLGVAFHPRFRENRKYYVKHQVLEDDKIATVLVEKQASPDGKTDSGKPSRRLLKMVSTTQDHSGGCIDFGPDGYLYLAMGDTGPQQDPQGHGQDAQLFLGKILRIDVDHRDGDLPYAIPADNPFRAQPRARPEIWALGFREPWRFSFDALTGDLWVGDVGQDRVEEVTIVRRGENHGWNVYEGFEPFSHKYRREGVAYVPPVFAYRRRYGNSVTGGYVYRGDKSASFNGVYICGDYTSKRIWGVRQHDRQLDAVRQIATAPQNIASFGTDAAGNIYVVGYEGMIYRLNLHDADFEGATVDSSDSPLRS
jgi:putative heme-binding domain-containing protein